jgi:nucleoside-diphosphate-sugar epimerase
MTPHRVFISGGTGYLGRALTSQLLAGGHRVLVLARPGSEGKVPAGAIATPGDALDATTFSARLGEVDTLVHLTGTPHPAPWKEREFRAIDQASLRASARAAAAARLPHFVYVSVAHPAPAMKVYITIRRECEALLEELGLVRTILRPWYVLGPGHNWPRVLKPAYALMERTTRFREGAQRLGLVTLDEMTAALKWAVENPPDQLRVLDVPAIRAVASKNV